MSTHVGINPVQGGLHHCLSELSLVERVKSIWWKQTHQQRASWMVGQTTLENKVIGLNLQRLMLVFDLDWGHRLRPYLTPGKPLARLCRSLPVQPRGAAVEPSSWEPTALARPIVPRGRSEPKHPFASCCSWISSWRVRGVFSATLIDGFIFQSIYLLNYPTVSKKSFLINMVISRSGWQQKHILVQFLEKANFPPFQFIIRLPPSAVSKLRNNIWWP